MHEARYLYMEEKQPAREVCNKNLDGEHGEELGSKVELYLGQAMISARTKRSKRTEQHE